MDHSGPVFPTHGWTTDSSYKGLQFLANEELAGLSKRELFAGLAMAAFCAHRGDATVSLPFMAEISVCAADALLAELAKEEGA